MTEDHLLVDEQSLQRRHERTAHDGHHQEGSAEVRILRVDILERDAIDAGEHDTHKQTDHHQRIQAPHTLDADGAEREDAGADAEDSEQLTRVHPLHAIRAQESSYEVERHGADIKHLCLGLVDAQMVGILYDERPHHDLRGHIAHLRKHALAVDTVVPEIAERRRHAVGLSGRLLLLALRHRHLGDGNHRQHDEHHQSDGHIRVADHGQVVQSDVGLLSLAQQGEDDLPGLIALVGEQLRQHDERGDGHAAERAHGIEGLRHVQPSRRRLLVAQREDERVGRGLQEGQTEGEDIQRDTEERELLVVGGGDEEERADGIERQSEQDAALIGIAPDEQRRRNGHRGIAAVEGELNQRGLGGRQFHHGLEGGHHRVGDVVGEAPECEQ